MKNVPIQATGEAMPRISRRALMKSAAAAAVSVPTIGVATAAPVPAVSSLDKVSRLGADLVDALAAHDGGSWFGVAYPAGHYAGGFMLGSIVAKENPPAAPSDAALFAMEGKWQAAMRVYEAAAALHSKAERSYFATRDALPPLPAPYELSGGTRAAVEAMSLSALGDKAHPANVARSAEIAARQALVDQRKSELDRIGETLGVDATSRKMTAALLRADRIARRIIAMPARTPAGLLLKLRINEGDAVEPDDMLDALTADLRAMNGEARA